MSEIRRKKSLETHRIRQNADAEREAQKKQDETS